MKFKQFGIHLYRLAGNLKVRRNELYSNMYINVASDSLIVLTLDYEMNVRLKAKQFFEKTKNIFAILFWRVQSIHRFQKFTAIYFVKQLYICTALCQNHVHVSLSWNRITADVYDEKRNNKKARTQTKTQLRKCTTQCVEHIVNILFHMIEFHVIARLICNTIIHNGIML